MDAVCVEKPRQNQWVNENYRQAEVTMEISVNSATGRDEHAVVGSIIAAFLTDPVARWLYPETHQYLAAMGSLIKAFAGKAFPNGSAYLVDGYGGAALWLPPNVLPNEEELLAILRSTVSEQQLESALILFEKMGSSHPKEPHWYLPTIGVDPTRQARGYGSALMTHALQTCDREQKLAYLESSNPRNLS
jgi:ribosomal protein S18 acetylase RimI-like enzyme